MKEENSFSFVLCLDFLSFPKIAALSFYAIGIPYRWYSEKNNICYVIGAIENLIANSPDVMRSIYATAPLFQNSRSNNAREIFSLALFRSISHTTEDIPTFFCNKFHL